MKLRWILIILIICLLLADIEAKGKKKKGKKKGPGKGKTKVSAKPHEKGHGKSHPSVKNKTPAKKISELKKPKPIPKPAYVPKKPVPKPASPPKRKLPVLHKKGGKIKGNPLQKRHHKSRGKSHPKSRKKSHSKSKEKRLYKSHGKSRSKSHEKRHPKSGGKGHPKSHGKSHSKSKEKRLRKSHGKSRSKSHEKRHPKSGRKSHPKSNGKSRSKSHEKRHPKSGRKSHSKSNGKSQSKSKEKRHHKSHGKSRPKSHEKRHSKLRGKSHSKSQGKSHSKSHEKRHPQSHGKSHHKSHGKSRSKSHSKSHRKSNEKISNRYHGCFQDKLLRKRILAGRMYLRHNSKELCINVCKKNKMKFAGLESGLHCRCENTLKDFTKISPTKCNIPCPGKRSQKCGGHFKLSIFETDVEEPSQQKDPCAGKCHKNAKCRRGKCVCRRGYYGDGIKTCEKSCLCMASGDPHYKTFDGNIIHFMGTCKYTLSKSTTANDACAFNVEVKNERRGSNKRVSFTRYVDVKIYGVSIRIQQGGKVLINGERKYLPFNMNTRSLRIFRSGRYTQVWSACGVKVNFDGRHAVSVVVPGKYKNKMTGLCGSCNGNKNDDFTTKDGINVSRKKNKYSLVGDSFKVNDESSPNEKCNTLETPPQECSKKMKALVASKEYCGTLTDTSGVFGECVKALPDIAKEFFASCQFDICAEEKDPAMVHKMKCSSLEAFAEECEENGFTVKWRSPKLCPLKCEDPNMEYLADGHGCPATCTDPNANDKCDLEPREGCFCKAGYVMSDGSCVKQSECGCKSNNGNYYPIGAKVTAANCKYSFVCMKTGGRPARFLQKPTGKRCGRDATCKLDKNGDRSCVCKKGFRGDGVHCKKIKNVRGGCKATCHKNGICRKGRCRCRRGFYGDGIKNCEKSCLCMASGDPHYKTFDGNVIHFMGTCKYTLTKSITPKDACAFNVEVKNERRGSNTRVSFTRYVDFEMYGITIRIQQKGKILVNGERKYLPIKMKDGSLRVFKSGRYTQISSACGIKVSFDGRHAVSVVVPRKYRNKMTGLCGGCNGNKLDDFTTRNGTNVSRMKNRYSLIGNSFMVNDESSPNEKCNTVEAPPQECSKTMKALVSSKSYCGAITDASGVFGECVKALPDMTKEFFESCQFDVCAEQGDPSMLQNVKCSSLEAFAEECEENGIAVKWRNSKLCPMKCEDPNMEYQAEGSGCPATCTDPNANENCDLEPREGCYCKAGYVMSDGSCVKQSECGCRNKKGDYYPIGEKVTSTNCLFSYECMKFKGKAARFVKRPSKKKCRRGAICRLDKSGDRSCVCRKGYYGDGVNCKKFCGKDSICHQNAQCQHRRKCVCRKGYIGDGIKSCKKFKQTKNGCKQKCHKNGICRKGRCRCRRGFYGDGIKSCEKSCLCMASGDPHYKTFDGNIIHFMGTCKYTLSKSTIPTDACAFNVEVKNEHRGSNTRVSFTRYIDFNMYGVSIRIQQGGKVLVNGERKYLPIKMKDGSLRIFKSGRYTQISSACGIKVSFDGRHAVSVVVPRTYRNKMTGLCGGCNGNKLDDFTTRNGTNVSRMKNRYSLIGNSFKVNDESSPNEKCNTVEAPPQECSKTMKALVSSKSYCGAITDASGVFGECMKALPDMAKEFFESCQFDVCAEQGDPSMLQNVKCSSLEAFAEECEENGIAVKWRNSKLCPMKCEDPNMEYQAEGSGCPATCTDPNANENCDLEPREGCYCKAGYVMSDGSCVKQSECGCRNKKGDYYPIGEKVTSANCLFSYECMKFKGKAARFVKRPSKKKCRRGAICRLDKSGDRSCVCRKGYYGDGVNCKKFCGKDSICHQNAQCQHRRKCVCRKGYIGDGIKSCKKFKQTKNGCKEKCHKSGVCRKGRCRCKRGFYGDGIKSCEKSCLCMASGDPHYKTFDGNIIHFMGTCKYTLSKSTIPKDACAFNVEVKNEHRGSNTRVSFTRYIDFDMYGVSIRIQQGGKVLVNGERKYLPIKMKDGSLRVFKSGRYTQISSACGIKVNFDGRHAVSVVVPRTYRNKMTGLCGGCNGNKLDDFTTRNGTNVSRMKNRYSLIGNSFKVNDESSPNEKCNTVEAPPQECSEKLKALVSSKSYCGAVTDISGVFGECVKALPEMAKEFFESCQFDVCAEQGDPSMLQNVKCSSLEAFAEECEENGIAVKWRNSKLCPMKCEDPNTEYQAEGSGCPATCTDPNANENCDLEPREGCYCKTGYVMSDGSCVKQSECGCRNKKGDYYPIGEKVTSANCLFSYECMKFKGKAARFVKRPSKKKCRRGAICRLDKSGDRSCVCRKGYYGDGVNCKKFCGKDSICHQNAQCQHRRKCVCRKGYIGDGIKSCKKFKQTKNGCKEKCHKNGVCRKGRCRCRRGFYGDGIKSCEKSCLCMASGDPHYKTFDGNIIHFMGTCKYTLSKSTIPKDACAFNVEVKNEHRGSNTRVSFTRYIDFDMYGVSIRIQQGGKVLVNGERKYLPIKMKDGSLRIFKSGRYTQISSACGIKVSFDGRHAVSVVVPRKYRNKMTGLCGGCNGNKLDDFTTRNGTNVSRMKNRYSLIGNSFKVNDESSPNEKCNTVEAPPQECSKTVKALVSSKSYCGAITDASGVFGECVKALPDMAKEFFESCQFDVCAEQGDPSMLQNVKCSSLEAFAEECEENGIAVKWRNSKLCPMKCEDPNMEYQVEGSGCPATCTDPSADENCDLEPREGCYCKAGYVMSDGSCVKQSECGCRNKKGDYYPIGEKVTSANCLFSYECMKFKGKAARFVKRPSKKKCGRRAICRLDKSGDRSCVCRKGYYGDGVNCKRFCGKKSVCHENAVCQRRRKCVCKKGFTGDGIESCKKIKQTKGGCRDKCHKNGVCRKGRCRCKRGFYGNGVESCEKSCLCMASGDPHYKTFDGNIIHFMGTCKYTLTKSTTANDACTFNVEVKNERRGKNKRVSFTRYVDVEIYGVSIRIKQGGTVLVNGERKYLPVKMKKGVLKVFKSGRYTQVWSKCGIKVNFDGRHAVSVVVPKQYQNKLTGLCGTCNGNKKDDFTTRNGTYVGGMRNRYSLVGNSFKVNDESSPNEKCNTVEAPPQQCSEKMKALVASKEYCGAITDKSGVFGKCVKAIPDIAKEFFDSCQFDVCSEDEDPLMIQKMKCSSLESFAEECEENGFIIKWRSSKLCPMKCEDPNMEYRADGSGCPATCLAPNSNEECDLEPREGCFCKPGYVISDGACVKETECGCITKEGDYYPIGAKITAANCEFAYECTNNTGRAAFVKKSTGKKCGKDAKCKLDGSGQRSCICKKGYYGDGVNCKRFCGKSSICHEKAKCKKGQCVCDKGFTGDGIKSCDKIKKPKRECKRKCHQNGVCRKGRCRCKRGYYGDGVSSCEKSCLCLASGNSHYKTYDGSIIHFMGTCKYTLTASTTQGDACAFNVEVKNEQRGNNSRISHIRYVDVNVYGLSVRLLPKEKVLVNGQRRYLPVMENRGVFRVFKSGRYVQIWTACGIRINFDGHSAASVVVPREYSNKMAGLCGNCNGDRDDEFTTRKGEDVRKMKNKHFLVGKSFKVTDKSSPLEKCSTIESPPEECSKKMEAVVASNNYCGVILDRKGVFAECINAFPDLANNFYTSCKLDICAVGKDPLKIEETKCESVGAFAEECAENGIAISWRNTKRCPLNCKDPNMEYLPDGRGCPATCADPTSSALACSLEPREGCFCKSGYVLSNDACVKPTECGCKNKHGDYYPIGAKMASKDCSVTYKCQKKNGKSAAKFIKISKGKKCGKYASCQFNDNGDKTCVCKKGFYGNGYRCLRLCGGKQKCHPKAWCRHGQCTCGYGYYGDGVKSCERMCFCSASGDPHYRTYDGQMIHFMGTCKYTMTQSLTTNDACAFKIEVKNEHRGINRRVAFTRMLDIKIYNKTIRLGKNRRVYIDGRRKTLPIEENDGNLSIFLSGRYVQVVTGCNIRVMWDGKSVVRVAVPYRYSKKMNGLCGDCNRVKDDYKTKEGENVWRKKNKYVLIGSSYQVPDDSDSPSKKCKTEEDSVQCTRKMEKVASRLDHCGFMDTKRKSSSPFKFCLSIKPLFAAQMYESCKFDVCSYFEDKAAVQEVVCRAFENFNTECSELGVAIKWRTDKFCPLKCGANQVYKPYMNGCPATCANPTAGKSCSVKGTEGCACRPGYLLSGTECVKKDQCGCKLKNGDYLPLNAEQESDDCTSSYKCQRSSHGTSLTKISSGRSCHRNGKCDKVDGVQQCVCKKGYIGDGVDKCHPLCGGKYRCHKDARCVEGVCLCGRDLYGDGVTSCQKTCTCTASGDPHYRTFDGQMIHFMGDCKYTLAEYTKSKSCKFNVEVKNLRRHENDKVSFTRLVDVKLPGITIRLHQGKRLTINGVRQYTPYELDDGKGMVVTRGRFITVMTTCGLIVSFDGLHYLTVTIPESLGKGTKGICGNCDGNKNDYKTKSGKDVSKKKNMYSLIGDSFKVFDDLATSNTKCKTKDVDITCTASVQDLVARENYCGLLANANGPFAKCIAADTKLAAQFFESCREDVCSFESNTTFAREMVCMSLEAFADVCSSRGYGNIVWRLPNFCPLKCGANAQYNPVIVDCPATCLQPDGPEVCNLAPQEGCECKEGYVLSGDRCVLEEDCGCLYKGHYYPLNAEGPLSSCDIVQKCVKAGGRNNMQIEQRSIDCHSNANCRDIDGQFKCVCNIGYVGDGEKMCTRRNKGDPEDPTFPPHVIPPEVRGPCNVKTTHSSCGSTIELRGDCEFESDFVAKCVYAIRTRSRGGIIQASAVIKNKQYRLEENKTVQECVEITNEGSVLKVYDRVCESCTVDFVRNIISKDTCTAPPS